MPPASPEKTEDRPPLCGILVLDKPAGISSMRAVAVVRRRAGKTKTGHAGTLDPLATGVLVLALGRATKIIDRLMDTDKRYRTEIDLSAFTDTDDMEGDREVIAIETPPDEAQLRNALPAFVGEIMQRPPAFSAVKIGGRRAYKLARAGQPVEIPPRRVIVYGIDLIRYEWPIVDLAIHCAKGFYVRRLARDLGLALGTGGHCRSIRRTAVGPFVIDKAISLEAVPDPLDQGHLISVDDALEMVRGTSRQETEALQPVQDADELDSSDDSVDA